ncbi:MAG: hypothetical protein O8C66_11300 [Candidatus Methanoperedens sp.]|nr:hypothetical protein [Candidatus Methanoperedens sp.]MCZ7371086.1 hypothetical protein [Candidatus Methanoperedens sp.]
MKSKRMGMMKEHVASSFHIEGTPFDGRNIIFRPIGDGMNMIISEMNGELAA